MISAAIENKTDLEVIDFLQTLVRAKSITPDDAGTLSWLSEQLSQLGFDIKVLEVNGVKNLIAAKQFGPGPSLGFIGHVDVVPANSDGWKVCPFSGEILEDCIYGRGVADMKGGIAAMLSATKKMLNQTSPQVGSLYWLITSDEEGEAEYGSKEIAAYLSNNNIVLDACLVGEPTADIIAGDTIKNGRRGALSGRIRIKGKAGHVAYPENSVNAAHISGNIINSLTNIVWKLDECGSKTGLQITGLQVNNSVDNIIPDNCEITFNVRYSHNYNSKAIIKQVEQALVENQAYIQCEWERPCESYYTGHKQNNCFLALVERAIYDTCGQYPKLTTAGGTSDGRFFSNSHTQVIECGVANATIHQVNERIAIADLIQVKQIYYAILKDYFNCK
ncbi:succinyl-diaminopimelate desuccinylase [Pseudoalteromonas sp. MTN2-4]|uniref:succinyl-diaminopimelate desuccinylase n=1 Tax=Pseudoalteromonas sp. MTN2-4 TaxID=3056555 RepID=UPI0036F37337